jgi:hypothetical protein
MNLNGTYIKIDIVFFVARRSLNRRSFASFAEQHTPWMSGRRMRGGCLGDRVQKGDHGRIPWTSGTSSGAMEVEQIALCRSKNSDLCVLFGANSLGLGDFPSTELI